MCPELVNDNKFASNSARVTNRVELVRIISDTLQKQKCDHWLEKLKGLGFARCIICPTVYLSDTSGRIPHGPINNIQQTSEHPQATAREVVIEVDVSICLIN